MIEGQETPFIFRSPFLPNQKESAIRQNIAKIERDLQFIQSHGYDRFVETHHNKSHESNNNNDEGGNDNDESSKVNLGTSFEGTLRDYQIYMLERAKKENIIAHLGTGMGKTLIGIFLIREFLSRSSRMNGNDEECSGKKEKEKEKSHILVLVPSIALAVQHTDTLRANLPCTVATACHTSSHSSKARDEIANARVIVATHGTALDLLNHYGDVLSMANVELLIIDECHYATGKHNYATILREYYHKLAKKERPRVLGLTASPLINVSVKSTSSQLQMLLSKFETIMDARLFGFPSDIGHNRKEAEESVVLYNSELDSFDKCLPKPRWDVLHKSRKKEIKQLQHLCNEVGLLVTAVYASTVLGEIGRNEYDGETPMQFGHLKLYLRDVTDSLHLWIDEGKGGKYGGHTNKMNRLENLLAEAVMPERDSMNQKQAPVGIVFVEMRITAIALCSYFCWKRKQQLVGACHAGDDLPSRQMDNTDGQPHGMNGQSMEDGPLSTQESTIRCDAVVRRATQIFKYLGQKHAVNDHTLTKLKEEELVHQTKQIRAVIMKLRRRETNVLMATSVVEEGVDVEACQFIIAFDGLTTIKSYIQMKGRARQKNARFHVFVDNALEKSQPLSLSNAQTMESVIHNFVAQNQNEVFDELPTISGDCEHESDEEEAMHYGKYVTSMSSVDLASSKSLLNRYALSVPLEPNSRTSKEATTLHMPIYVENKLILPSHLPPTIREVNLPIAFHGEAKKKKQSFLALAACVRLHKLGLLNERLLPLSTSDMKDWLLEKALLELPSCRRHRPTCFETPCTAFYVYSICQSGVSFKEEEEELSQQESGVMRLALLSLSVLPKNLPVYSFKHKELGSIECRVSYCGKKSLSAKQWKDLTDFHCAVFNSRWQQRRKRSKRFCFDEGLLADQDRAFPPYFIGCIDAGGDIDWILMQRTIREFSRSLAAREEAAQRNRMERPRICSPSYNQGVSYIVYGPSGKQCKDPFPGEDYSSFQDYYAKKYCLQINPNGNMFLAKRVMDLPQTLKATKMEPNIDNDTKIIPSVELPEELLAECLLADPIIVLHSVILPQLLYRLESYLTVMAFIQHCVYNFPILGYCLTEISDVGLNRVVESLTAKSCCMDVTYDRLEWLGDAVLKLLHTDSLLKWEYTSYLHEGYLTMIRSVMGSNDRLKDIASAAGFDKFILLRPLNRAEWSPFGLRYCGVDENGNQDILCNDDNVQKREPSNKMRADVIEALMGLIFIEFGYEQCAKVAHEMRLSLPADIADNICRTWCSISPDQDLVSFAVNFVGGTRFHNPCLLVEATTHQSCLHKPVPSYQRLEWVGDAVLCLAAREWLFRREEQLPVSKLVVLETTLVCNESLAYLGYAKGLHRFVDHRNAAFPGRFQSYELDLDMGRGLWSTDPPKVISDVVEALIGAVHVDSGFHYGQRAVQHVIKPLLQPISCLLTCEYNGLTSLLHPKQNLYEMSGGIISVRAYKEDAYHRLKFSSPLCNFGNRSCGGAGYVGVVRCKQIILATAVEKSKLAAINVVCELTVQILKEDPSIISRLQELLLLLAK